MSDFPRRVQIQKFCPAETSIYNAMGEVEKMAADERLTWAQILLQRARDLVADFIDGVPLRDEYKRLAAVQQVATPERWIAVGERLPESCSTVWAYDGASVRLSWFVNEGGEGPLWFESADDLYEGDITHWAPLAKPAAPARSLPQEGNQK